MKIHLNLGDLYDYTPLGRHREYEKRALCGRKIDERTDTNHTGAIGKTTCKSCVTTYDRLNPEQAFSAKYN